MASVTPCSGSFEGVGDIKATYWCGQLRKVTRRGDFGQIESSIASGETSGKFEIMTRNGETLPKEPQIVCRSVRNHARNDC